MTITICKQGEQEVDVTDRLATDTDIVIDAVLERRAFQRSVEDLPLKLSNLTGMFVGGRNTCRRCYR
jgi:hypothetical protein